jgi:hypothetical protein
MSKKKQLTGKKTKLAKLPLTKALSQQLEEPRPFATTVATPEPEAQQLPLSWERLEEGAAGLLTAAYALVVQDLLSIQAEFPWAGEEPLSTEEILPTVTPPAHRVKQALRQAREELSDLHRLLSS